DCEDSRSNATRSLTAAVPRGYTQNVPCAGAGRPSTSIFTSPPGSSASRVMKPTPFLNSDATMSFVFNGATSASAARRDEGLIDTRMPSRRAVIFVPMGALLSGSRVHAVSVGSLGRTFRSKMASIIPCSCALSIAGGGGEYRRADRQGEGTREVPGAASWVNVARYPARLALDGRDH